MRRSRACRRTAFIPTRRRHSRRPPRPSTWSRRAPSPPSRIRTAAGNPRQPAPATTHTGAAGCCRPLALPLRTRRVSDHALGACTSCWSFSATGAMEGAYQIATGQLVSLSEEDLMRAIRPTRMRGRSCLQLTGHGAVAESDYKYISGTGISGWQQTKEAMKIVSIKGYHDVPSGDEDASRLPWRSSRLRGHRSGQVRLPAVPSRACSTRSAAAPTSTTASSPSGMARRRPPSAKRTTGRWPRTGANAMHPHPARPTLCPPCRRPFAGVPGQELVGRDVGPRRLRAHCARQEHVRHRHAAVVPTGAGKA